MANEQAAEVINLRERLHRRVTLYLGHIAIGHEHLGINDPKTHLHMYLERGEEAMSAIEEDLVADIAERLPEDPFRKRVDFEFTGTDFVSRIDRVSLKAMTAENERIFREEAVKNKELSQEYARAKIEMAEAHKLPEWFKEAEIGSYMVFDALPIGEQEYAIPRIFRKKSPTELEGHFLSLHNASVEVSNKQRHRLGVQIQPSSTVLELLANNYEFPSDPDFINRYIDTYDEIQKENDPQGRDFAYGLAGLTRGEVRNGAEVANNPSLITIYKKTVKELASSSGIATPGLMRIIKNLKIDTDIYSGERLTLDKVGELMEKVIAGIAATVDNASTEILEGLNQRDTYSGAAMDAVGHFGGQATSNGQSYGSRGCPSADRTTQQNGQAKGNEAASLAQAYRLNGVVLEDFGKPKWGVCRTANCISRGESIFWPSKTLVGGCDLCVDCHIYYKKGKDPKQEHKKMTAELKARKDAKEKQKQQTKQRQQQLARVA